MQRRGFLMAASAALAAPALAQDRGDPVAVIGAGLAGLAAAQTLQAAGLEVLVIEARSRIGGRVVTSRQWGDLPVDLGASWIHGARGNPLTALARDAGVQTVATSYDRSLMIDAQSDRIDPDLREAQALLRQALRAADARESDQSVAQALAASAAYRGASPALRRLVDHVVNSTLEQEYGGSASRLSAWYGDEGESFGGEDRLFPQGFDQIATYLAQGVRIRRSSPVRRIAPGQVGLATGEVVRAGRILCTLPLGVLRSGSVDFSRPLSRTRSAAITALETGLLNKCWLRFDRVTWPDDVDWIEWLGPTPGVWAEWVSGARALRQPVLLGFNAADQAAWIEGLNDRDTVASAVEGLRAMFGSAFPAPFAAQVTRWGQDFYARGSYSFNAVGTGPMTREALFGADWDGALWFAGEATEPDHFGTAHGAVLSGRRAARAILDT